MERAVADVANAMTDAEPQRGHRRRRSSGSSARPGRSSAGSMPAAINTGPASVEELHRRHLPMITQLSPLISAVRRQGVFRVDLPVAWHVAVIRATSTPQASVAERPHLETEVEPVTPTTAPAAISGPKTKDRERRAGST